MILAFCVSLALLLFSPVTTADESTNIAAVQGMIDAVNDRRLDDLDRYVAADIVRHSGATPGISVTNIMEFREFLESDIASMPDSVQEIELIFSAREFVAVRALLSGTQSGQMGPFPPTGKRVQIPFIGILRIEDGKVAEIWVEWDNLSTLTQLGHLAPPD